MTQTNEPRDLPDPLHRDSTPMDVAQCEALSIDVRTSLLQEWLADEVAVARALNEGMVGGPVPRVAEVERAIDALQR